jgi:2'-5' RNA ligase
VAGELAAPQTSTLAAIEMAESAFAVNVPEAEPYVGALRERFDPSAKLGVPAHITVLYPFMSPEQITEAVLGNVRLALSSAATFTFCLVKFGRFPGALYLAPQPTEPFIGLTERLVRQFPDHLPYGGQYDCIVPHLTVAQAGEAEHSLAEAHLATSLPPRTGIQASCNEVVLIENSSGRWKHMHSFPLAPSPSQAANPLMQPTGRGWPAAD